MQSRPAISRRALVVAGTLASVGITGCSDEGERPSEKSSPSDESKDNAALQSYSAALHVHSSFSEGPGSMHAQLAEADRLGVDVVCWTDHDWRMQAVGYWDQVSFASDTAEQNGLQWTWTLQDTEEVGGGRHEFGAAPQSNGEAQEDNCLFLSRSASAGRAGEHRLTASADRDTYRTSLNGQRIEIDVFPERVSTSSWLALDVLTSYRPAIGERQAGRYRLSYRVGGSESVGSQQAGDLLGVITLDAPEGKWTRLTLEPSRDLSALWSDIDGRDASSFELSVVATAGQTETAAGYFRSLTFERNGTDGDEPLRTQAELIEHYRVEFPEITQIAGTEISLDNPHFGAIGGDLGIPRTPGDNAEVVNEVSRSGTLVCYNHPFGSSKEELTRGQRDALVSKTASALVDSRVLGCTLMEVGYRSRGGATLDDHEKLWDACSRAAIFLTGLGTNDNHTGRDWDVPDNNFLTWLWAKSSSQGDLLAALASGHAYFGDPTRFTGTLDLRTASGARMGHVVVAEDHGPKLSVHATGLPQDCTVEVVGLTMMAGASESATLVPQETDYEVSELSAGSFSSGVASIPLTAEPPIFYRAKIVDASGEVIALSNPIWLLNEEPSGGLASSRRP